MANHKENTEVDERFMEAINTSTEHLMSLGFYDEALELALSVKAEEGLKGGGYQWRAVYFSEVNAVACRLALNKLDLDPHPKKNRPKDVEAAGFLNWRLKNLKTVPKSVARGSELVKIKVSSFLSNQSSE